MMQVTLHSFMVLLFSKNMHERFTFSPHGVSLNCRYTTVKDDSEQFYCGTTLKAQATLIRHDRSTSGQSMKTQEYPMRTFKQNIKNVLSCVPTPFYGLF